MTQYDLIIYDFDGTLCATHVAITHCIRKTFSFFDTSPPNEPDVRQVIGLGLEESFTRLRGKPVENMASWVGKYREIYGSESSNKTFLFPNVVATLETLQQRGVRQSVFSNKGLPAVLAALEQFGIKDYFDLILGDVKGIKRKPDPSLFREVISPHFPGAEKVLMVGDTATDIQFARNASIDACWVTFGYGSSDQCQMLAPNFVIGDLSELCELA